MSYKRKLERNKEYKKQGKENVRRRKRKKGKGCQPETEEEEEEEQVPYDDTSSGSSTFQQALDQKARAEEDARAALQITEAAAMTPQVNYDFLLVGSYKFFCEEIFRVTTAYFKTLG